MQEIDLAQKAFAAEQQKGRMGTGNNADFNRRKTAALNLEQELAVLDAMLSQSLPAPKKK